MNASASSAGSDRRMIIEARINEYAMRDDNRHVPWTPDEIAETAARCREAGASIVHFHARQPDGAPEHSVAAYAEIIRKIRQRSDVLVHPTLGWFANDHDPAGRIACVTALAQDAATRPDIAPIDTGSVNLESWDAQAMRFDHPERVYINRTETLQHYAREFVRVGIKPQLVTWDIGFTRRACALMDQGLVQEPAYFLVNMTEGRCITGHPGTPEGLQAHLQFLPRHRRVLWSANVVGGSLLTLAEMAARLGGHVAPGIGDHAYAELSGPPNEETVARVARIAREAGRYIATPTDAREMLGLAP